jgi:hypothetical protein
MPKRWCIGCRSLFDLDSTGTLRCPDCQAAVTRQRNARPPRASRGYGAAHDRTRAELLVKFRPGDPCALCGEAMASRDGLDLAHNKDRTGWKGLAHASCNRGHVNE